MNSPAVYGSRAMLRRGSDRRTGASAVLLLMAALAMQACSDDQSPDAVVHVVEVTPLQSTMQVGDTIELTASPKGPDGSLRQGVPVEWSTRHPALVAVTGAGRTGRVVALKAGLAEVSAGSHGKSGLAIIQVRNVAPGVTALEPSMAPAGGPGFVLVVHGTGFATDAQVTWNGQPRATQRVSAQELRATIPAADIDVAGTVQVGVRNPQPGGGVASLPFVITSTGVARIDLSPAGASVVVGQTVKLTATPRDVLGNDLAVPVAWQSGSPQVATVSNAGVVTGVAAGTAVISASAAGITAYAAVTVGNAQAPAPVITSLSPDSVESNPNGLEVVIRGTGFLPTSGAFLESSGRPTEYVSATELKMQLFPGDLNKSITRPVRVYNPGGTGVMSAAASLRIVPGVWSVRVQPSTGIALWPGQQQQATATAYDEQNRPVTGRTVTWRSENPAVATVDQAGVVRAVAPGHTTIEATVGERVGFLGVQVHATLPYDLLYEGTHGGYPELWLLTLGPDAAPRRILAAGTFGADPAASPDGSRIAFVGLSADGARNIFVVDRNGTNLRQLTFDVETDDQPAWSRDGTRIAFRSMREGVSDIFVISADGTGLKNVTTNVQRGADGRKAAERPTWTPEGRVIFTFGYALVNPLSYHLVSVAADGSDWRALTDGYLRDFEPEVSPNGKLIALRRFHEQYGSFIDVIAANGSQLGWINLPGPGHTPSWSPDGTWLTYSHSEAPGQSAIYMGALNGGSRMIVPAGGRNPVWIRR
jgi:Tol biopolymer transport system component/uncharacterized protein YjdB